MIGVIERGKQNQEFNASHHKVLKETSSNREENAIASPLSSFVIGNCR
jgi:hypothetical protein